MISNNTIERVYYHGQRIGSNTMGLCDLAELRHIKSMAILIKEGYGINGVELYDQKRRTVISQGLRIGLYDKRTIHFLTGNLKNTLAIEENNRIPKMRVRVQFPNLSLLKNYQKKEINFNHQNNQILEWAFTHFLIDYNYEELFNILVPITFLKIFGESLEYP